MKNDRGVTLAELMVAVGIFGVVVYTLTGSSTFLNKLNSNVKNKLTVERTVISLSKALQSNISNAQITYDDSTFMSMTSEEALFKNLPLAWNDKVVVDVADCKSCKGRMGYVLVPHIEYRGLYKLTVRVVHKTLFKGFKDYTFLINGK